MGKGGLQAYENTDFLKIIFRIQGSILDNVFPKLVATVVLSVLAAFLDILMKSMADCDDSDISELPPCDDFGVKIDSKAFTLPGTAISFLLVFRSSISYSRFWEGRGHLGTIVQHSRDFGRQSAFIVKNDVEGKIRFEMVRFIQLFWILTQQHSRDENKPGGDKIMKEGVNHSALQDPEIVKLTTREERGELKEVGRRPLWALGKLTEVVVDEYKKQNITHMAYLSLTQNMCELIGGFNGVDKIHKTPIPFPYAQMLIIFITVYVAAVPFFFVTDFGWANVAPSCVICLAYFGINEVAIEIEDPFGYDENDLPLETMYKALCGDLEMFLVQADPDLYKDNIESYLPQNNKSKKQKKSKEKALVQSKARP